MARYKEIDWAKLADASRFTYRVSVEGYRPGRACMVVVDLLDGTEVIGTTTTNMFNCPVSVAVVRCLTKAARMLKYYRRLGEVSCSIELADVPTYWLLTGTRVSAHTAEKRAMAALRKEFSGFNSTTVVLVASDKSINNAPVDWLNYPYGNRKNTRRSR